MLKPNTSKTARRAGFTLVEIMVVLGVIAILAGLAINKLSGVGTTAAIQRADMDISTITTAIKSYELLAGSKPSTGQGLAALVNRPSGEPIPRRWTQQMNEVPKDPWQKEFQYRSPGTKNPNGFDLYSLGPDGVPSEDDIGNWTK